MSRHRKLLLLCLVLLAFGRLPSTGEPLTQDQAVFTLGGKLILQGERLYLDVFDHKPPLMYFVYAPIYLLFGPTGLGPAIVDLLLHLLQCVLLFYILSHLEDERTGAYGVIVFVYLLLCPVWSRGIRLLQAEVIANFLVLLMAYLSLEGRIGNFTAWFLGVCASLLFATKFLPLLFVAVPLLLLDRDELRSRRVWVLGLLGFFCGILPWLIYLLYMGVWSHFIMAVWGFNRCYAGSITNPLWPTISAKAWALWLPSLLALYGLRLDEKKKSPSRLVALTWLFVALFVFFVQRKFFYYHFIVLLIPLSWLAGRGLNNLYGKIFEKSEVRPWVKSMAVFVLFIQLALLLFKYSSFHEKYFYQRLWNGDFPGYAEATPVTTNRTLLETILLAAAIKKNSEPSDELLVWGMNPLLYLVADRKPAIPYILHNWLVLDRLPFDKWGDSKKRRQTFLKKMRENPPACFVVATGDRSVLAREDSYEQLTSDSELYGILRSNYSLTLRVRNSYLWVHKSKVQPLQSRPQ